MFIPDILKAQMIIMAVGLIVTIVSFRSQYRANVLSVLAAIGLIYLAIIAPAGLNYFRHFTFGDNFEPRLNFFWIFLSYWLGMKWCDRYLPRFSVYWGEDMNRSLIALGFYQCLASCFAWNQIVFVFLMIPGFLATVLLPLGSIWARGSGYVDVYGNGFYELY